MENWKERFRNQFVDTYGEKDSKEWRIAYQPIEELEDFISQELDKAREEGVEAGMVNAREMVSAFLDTLDVDKNEEEIRILRGINELLEAITGLALKLKDKK